MDIGIKLSIEISLSTIHIFRECFHLLVSTLFILGFNYFLRDCMFLITHYHECLPVLLCIQCRNETQCLEATGLGQVQQTSAGQWSLAPSKTASMQCRNTLAVGPISHCTDSICLIEEVAKMNGYMAVVLGQIRLDRYNSNCAGQNRGDIHSTQAMC